MGFSPGMQGWFTLENNPCDSHQQMKKNHRSSQWMKIDMPDRVQCPFIIL